MFLSPGGTNFMLAQELQGRPDNSGSFLFFTRGNKRSASDRHRTVFGIVP